MLGYISLAEKSWRIWTSELRQNLIWSDHELWSIFHQCSPCRLAQVWGCQQDPSAKPKKAFQLKSLSPFAIRVPRRVTTSTPCKLLAKMYIIFVQFTIPSCIWQYEMKSTLGHYGKGWLNLLRKVLIVVANKCFDVWYCTAAKKKERKFQSHSEPETTLQWNFHTEQASDCQWAQK